MPSLADFIRARRGETGRAALAARARDLAPGIPGIHTTAIERWEAGEGTPTGAQLRALIEATGGTDDDLSLGLSLLVGTAVVVVPAADSAPALEA